MRYVLDLNVALKWAIVEPDSDKALRLRDDYRNAVQEFIAPETFLIECANALTRKERQKLINDARLYWGEILADGPVYFPTEPLLDRAIEISRKTYHNFYDCLYVALALLVAGVAIGLWLLPNRMRMSQTGVERAALIIVFVLGGLSLVGPPLLLWARYRRRTRLGLGELLWFAQGMASWLLWPPLVVRQVNGNKSSDSMSAVCYFYGTPLMALYIVISLFASGWVVPKRRYVRSWRDAFGLLLALAWACTGLYILSLIYRQDLSR